MIGDDLRSGRPVRHMDRDELQDQAAQLLDLARDLISHQDYAKGAAYAALATAHYAAATHRP
jgi:hypothetical protein